MQKSKQEDKINEIPIEEFDDDDQDIHLEFLKKFENNESDNEEETTEKSIKDDIQIKNDYTRWL